MSETSTSKAMVHLFDRNNDLAFSISKIHPSLIRIGDIVEISFALISCNLKHSRKGMLPVLRGIFVKDTTYSMVSINILQTTITYARQKMMMNEAEEKLNNKRARPSEPVDRAKRVHIDRNACYEEGEITEDTSGADKGMKGLVLHDN